MKNSYQPKVFIIERYMVKKPNEFS